MPDYLETIRPGEIISSDMMRYVVSKLQELEERIADLESETGPTVRITSFDPADEQHVGRTLTVVGTNFAMPPTLNEVLVGTVRISEFLPSSTTMLRFRVPFVSGTPRNLTITVRNSAGEDSRLYRVLSEVPVAGEPPVIEAVRRPDGGTTLRPGEPFVIQGSNFAADPAANVITIASRIAGRENEVYGVTDIDAEASSQAEIHALLPDDIALHNPFFDPMLLSLTVGAHDPVLVNVNVEAAP